MSAEIRCYGCGSSLAALTLPIGRQDACPDCSLHVHVCRMCVNFDSAVPKQCREDDAEEVYEKERANFCEWYVPSTAAFLEGRIDRQSQAAAELDALFTGERSESGPGDPNRAAAEDLFK